jgi:hypothetical protein
VNGDGIEVPGGFLDHVTRLGMILFSGPGQVTWSYGSVHTPPQGPVLHWLSAEGTFQLLCPGWLAGSWGL